MILIMLVGTLFLATGAFGCSSYAADPTVGEIVANAAWMISGAILIAGGAVGAAIGEKK